jgi:hypothetical protein
MRRWEREVAEAFLT